MPARILIEIEIHRPVFYLNPNTLDLYLTCPPELTGVIDRINLKVPLNDQKGEESCFYGGGMQSNVQ